MLKALEAAEAGDSSPLLDDDFLADTTFLDDNSPLVRKNDETSIAPAPQATAKPRPGAPAHRSLDPRLRRRAAQLRDARVSPTTPEKIDDALTPDVTESFQRDEEAAEERPLDQTVTENTAPQQAPEPKPEDNVPATVDGPDETTELSTEPEGLLNPADLDALVADTAMEDVPDVDSTPTPTSEDLDVLINTGEADVPIPEDARSEDLTPTPTAEDLSEILATPTSEDPEVIEAAVDDPAPTPEDLDEPVESQPIDDEIQDDPTDDETDPTSPSEDPEAAPDTSVDDVPADETTATEEKSDPPISQSDLAAMLSEVPVSEYETTDEPEADVDGMMSQEDLDALLDATAGESDGEVASLTDEDLDGLFNELDGTPTGNVEAAQDAGIDAALNELDDEQSLDGSKLDAPVIADTPESEGDVSLSDSSLDELMSDINDSGEEAASANDEEDGDMGGISQDMIDSLIASAQQEASDERGAASKSEVGSENLAAAATAAPAEDGTDLHSQSDLDKLIDGSRGSNEAESNSEATPNPESLASARKSTTLPASTPTGDNKGTRFRRPSVVGTFILEHSLRLVACALVGSLFALSSGIFMHMNREYRPGGDSDQDIAALEVAIERGREKLAAGNYPGVVAELEEPIARAHPSALRNDARFLQLEAKYLGFRGQWGDRAFDDLSAETDEILETASSHRRAPEALYWKARLYTNDQPVTAMEIYKNIFDHYESAANRDQMFLDAAQLALELDDPLTTYTYAQRLLNEYPASPWAGEAILAIGDANMKAGLIDDARTMYIRVVQDAQDTALGAKAVIRLGQLAYDTGQYDTAKNYLRNQLETTTTLEGNDEVYLLLAKTYRAANELENARDMLNDLLTFFEESELRPDAFIEYTQVLEALGERDRALKTAQRGVLEYPDNHRVLRNDGELQGLAGHPIGAANALVAADRAGAGDPGLLLSAARYYRAASMPDEAKRTYARLKSKFAGSNESLSGGIEGAQLRFAEGETEEALNDLKALQAATRGTVHYLPSLIATQTIYRDLGLAPHIQRTAMEIITEAVESETLAEAAIDLLNTGELESAQGAIGKLNFSKLRPRTAHKLLMKEGEALLAVAPQRGLEKMEEAYFNYPEVRTRKDDQLLLQTYLDTGKAAAARRMVMDLRAHVDSTPIDTPYLIDAAIAWGDYLYSKEDYRTAAFAFSIAEDAGGDTSSPVTGLHTDPNWARYQRANALLKLADYEGCLSLFDDIAASDSPWAREAEFKASMARQEQRRRGISGNQSARAG